MDYVERIVSSLKSSQLDKQLWGATFAAGADDESGTIVDALLSFLESECRSFTGSRTISYDLCVGRAAVSLATSLRKLEIGAQQPYISQSYEILTRLETNESIEISHHAKHALRILETLEKNSN